MDRLDDLVEQRRALDRAMLLNHALVGDPPAQMAARERALLETLRRPAPGAPARAVDPAWEAEVAKTEAAFAALEREGRGPLLRVRPRKSRQDRVEMIMASPTPEVS